MLQLQTLRPVVTLLALTLVASAWAAPDAPHASAAGDAAVQVQIPAAEPTGADQTVRAPIDLDKVEKELKQLRAKYFRATRNAQTREIGYTKLRSYTDAAVFPLLVKLFGTEDTEVRRALVEHLAARKTVEADTNLARIAVFGEERSLRERAGKELADRYDRGRIAVPYVVQQPLADGLRTSSYAATVAAAQLCDVLNLIDAIPLLISAQATNNASLGRPVNGDAQPAIAALVVGQQESFVSGLTPIVGNSAVGFNPQVSVLNTGTVLRIIDANVITYRTEVTAALGALASRNWGGQPVTHLGSDAWAWSYWYKDQFIPYRDAVDAAAKASPKQ